MKNLKTLSKKLTAAAASAVMALTSLGVSVPAVANAEDKDYYKALAMSLYMYDANACGKGISDGPLTWRGDCHTYDSNCAVGTLDGSANPPLTLTATEKSIFRAASTTQATTSSSISLSVSVCRALHSLTTLTPVFMKRQAAKTTLSMSLNGAQITL